MRERWVDPQVIVLQSSTSILLYILVYEKTPLLVISGSGGALLVENKFAIFYFVFSGNWSNV